MGRRASFFFSLFRAPQWSSQLSAWEEEEKKKGRKEERDPKREVVTQFAPIYKQSAARRFYRLEAGSVSREARFSLVDPVGRRGASQYIASLDSPPLRSALLRSSRALSRNPSKTRETHIGGVGERERASRFALGPVRKRSAAISLGRLAPRTGETTRAAALCKVSRRAALQVSPSLSLSLFPSFF